MQLLIYYISNFIDRWIPGYLLLKLHKLMAFLSIRPFKKSWIPDGYWIPFAISGVLPTLEPL